MVSVRRPIPPVANPLNLSVVQTMSKSRAQLDCASVRGPAQGDHWSPCRAIVARGLRRAWGLTASR
jgi:hypothetical protein